MCSSDLSNAASNGGPTQSSNNYVITTSYSYYFSNGGASVSAGGDGFYPAGDGGFNSSITSASPPGYGKPLTADFNGDGKEDLIRRLTTTDSARNTYSYLNTFLSNYGYQDLMRSVTDGMGSTTSIDYEPLTGVNGIQLFTKSTDAVAPAIDLIEPMPVVAGITYDNGLGVNGSSGSTYSISYRYEGLKADPLRGMLGFRAIEAIDNRAVDGQSGLFLHSKSWLKQGFPYTGMTERSCTYLTAPTATKSFTDHTGLLSDAITTYAAGPTENNNTHIYFPYAQDSHV